VRKLAPNLLAVGLLPIAQLSHLTDQEGNQMGLLDGKVALLFGLANKHSIAWGICESLHREGAQLAVSYGIERLEKRARPLAESVGAKVIELCDVRNDEQLDHVFKRVEEEHGKIDILIHSVAYAQKDDLIGRYVDTSREGFATALDVSVYSLVGMAKRAEPLMAPGSSILTMTYYGGVKVVPNYNIMGICKAALEMSVRYLSADLGPKQIRVNAISAGPIKTLAASGISDFNRLLDIHAGAAPLRPITARRQDGLRGNELLNTDRRGRLGGTCAGRRDRNGCLDRR